MKRLCVEGWRGINHSYALVNQWQLLHMCGHPLELFHLDKPFVRDHWNPLANGSGLAPAAAALVASVPAPPADARFDAIYRIASPYDLAPGPADRVYVFGTAEYQHVRDELFTQGGVHDAPRRENLFIVTPSQWSKAGFEVLGFPPERIRVVSHGVEPDHFHPATPTERATVRRLLQTEDDDFVLLSIGAMTKNKGIDLLLVAYAILRQRHPHLRLVLKDQSALYGIRAEAALEDLLASPRYGHLFTQEVIAGIRCSSSNLDLAELRQLYGSVDCYVSPYRAEGFNMPPLEAAACGTPIVVTGGGSTDDYFHQSLGLQIEAKRVRVGGVDPREMMLEPVLDSLVAALDHVIEKRAAFGGEPGSQHVHRSFSWRECTERLLQAMDLVPGPRLG